MASGIDIQINGSKIQMLQRAMWQYTWAKQAWYNKDHACILLLGPSLIVSVLIQTWYLEVVLSYKKNDNWSSSGILEVMGSKRIHENHRTWALKVGHWPLNCSQMLTCRIKPSCNLIITFFLQKKNSLLLKNVDPHIHKKIVLDPYFT